MVALRLGIREDVTTRCTIPPFSTNPRRPRIEVRLGHNDPSAISTTGTMQPSLFTLAQDYFG
jgi:hypothetical protein